MRSIPLRLLAAPLALLATWTPAAEQGQALLEAEARFSTIEDLPEPSSGDALEVGCLQVLPGDRLAVGTRRGVILIAHHVSSPDPRKITWTVFARGLFEPLGLQWREAEQALYVIQKTEFTRLLDRDGDGRADRFETVTDRWSFSGNYHEFAFGAPQNADGSTWLTLCLTGSSTSPNRWRGWAMLVGTDGSITPAASGIRSPGGMGQDASGATYYCDNQGFWNGTSSVKELKRGGFLGAATGNRWYADAPGMGPQPVDPQPKSRIVTELARIPTFIPPAVLFPHGIIGQSPTQIICDRTGATGPFKDQLFVAEQTFSQIQRVIIERVNGVAQGTVIPYRSGFGVGCIGLQLLGDGTMYVGGSSRGWGSRGRKPWGLQRLRPTGAVPFEIATVTTTTGGFRVTFTAPVEAASLRNPDSYRLAGWTYIYQDGYGSPQVDRITPKLTAVEPASDGRSVLLKVEGCQAGHVHELNLEGLRAADGAPLLHPVAYTTINEFPHAP